MQTMAPARYAGTGPEAFAEEQLGAKKAVAVQVRGQSAEAAADRGRAQA